MNRTVAYMNVGHTLDHFFMLILPTAVLGMAAEFGATYGELITLGLGGFIAFGAGSLPAGWLGDRWSQRNMMAIFFFGIGAASILTAFAQGPVQLAICLTLIGLAAAIYHPVGTAMLVANAQGALGRTLGLNGVFGNVGVAGAALVSGFLTTQLGWRSAFLIPGVVSIAIGAAFVAMVPSAPPVKRQSKPPIDMPRVLAIRIFVSLVLSAVAGGIIFNTTTVSLPKLMAERVDPSSAAIAGQLAFVVFLFGALAQLLIGRLADRMPLGVLFLPVALAQAPLLFLAAGLEGHLLLPVAAALMFVVFGQVTINETMVAQAASAEWRARVFAVRYLLSFGASAGSVWLVGFLHDRTAGLGASFETAGAIALLVLVSALIFPRPARSGGGLAAATK